MPTFFFGHGNPMNALWDNNVTAAWKSIGRNLPRPRAILCISAHWYTRGTRVSPQERPETIHDFGGFPPQLSAVEYPAPGDPQLAARVRELLRPAAVLADPQWGLDHGTWVVLRHLRPDADLPVVQLSVDRTLAPADHFELGRRLAPLRDEGVVIIGSGNVVHNLHAALWGERAAEPFDWALRFEQRVREMILTRDHDMLVDYPSLGADALLSIPTPDHYLPLLYILAVTRPSDRITIPAAGIQNGSVSMLAIGYS
ncbi:4,5-DOPA dioxygenase extradiol [Geomonas sp. Red875]|uniref:4,5-DOPA dioxygenase extradiol n=2 Tax=Geomesophilobacter sediminis TaxID=2798584 RepID=A0A8J7M045_9BACT|nr:4,5-DOPA dioxygenase extradiol [Geomesophilobacter sediminis]